MHCYHLSHRSFNGKEQSILIQTVSYKANVRQNHCIDRYIINNFEYVRLRPDKTAQHRVKSMMN